MAGFGYQKDEDGIVIITMDMDGPVNSMTEEYQEAMEQAVSRLEAERDITGVVLTSAKKTFFAGGNIQKLLAQTKNEEKEFKTTCNNIKYQLRRLEKLNVPVVAAINGAALGGGYEICLACNYRIAWKNDGVLIGLPEVDLGLLPGGGGIVRLVNLIGLTAALPYLIQGKKVTPDVALRDGLIDDVVDDADELIPEAKAYLRKVQGDQRAAVNPWDAEGFTIPGGSGEDLENAAYIQHISEKLDKQTRGLLPAPHKILEIAVKASKDNVDSALEVETQGLADLVVTPVSKNLITTFFFQMNKINTGASRPKGPNRFVTRKVGVIGAGMMGQGIAYCSALAGIQVVLKDISLEAAEKGKSYSATLLDHSVKKGAMTMERRDEVLGRIVPTANNADLQGCDLIIEAVFEDLQLKKKITRDSESFLADGGVWGTNTSSLPVAKLAEASENPANFIGIHFFSPVERMPLVEIIMGDKTSEETLAKAFDYTRQIKKTPIVVNDSLQFFTSRVYGTYLDEGMRLVSEGLHPQRIDDLAKGMGMPVGPLQVHDETSLKLTQKCWETWSEMGYSNKWYDQAIGENIVNTLVDEYGRGGRQYGGGFYDYNKDGSRSIWEGLLDLYYQPTVSLPDQDVKDRLLFRQVVESLRCLESGVLRSVADGNVGSVLGIGAPKWTGGFIQFVNTYGLKKFANRCDELAALYGERFKVPEVVESKLAANATFD